MKKIETKEIGCITALMAEAARIANENCGQSPIGGALNGGRNGHGVQYVRAYSTLLAANPHLKQQIR